MQLWKPTLVGYAFIKVHEHEVIADTYRAHPGLREETTIKKLERINLISEKRGGF